MGRRLTNNEFIERSIKIHNGKYDYSKVDYINNSTKVCIICPIHGEFWQVPSDHMRGFGCSYCGNSHKLTKEQFIEQAKKVHGDKYDYSKVDYINSKTKVCIICPIHGEFWQTPYSHLKGNGCPYCNESHLEKSVFNILKKNNIIFDRQKHFDWLGRQSLDFYLPEYNIAIECQGIQHFKSVELFGGKNNLEKTVKNDNKKFMLCSMKNIKLLYYSDLDIDYPYYVIKNEKELINSIWQSIKL